MLPGQLKIFLNFRNFVVFSTTNKTQINMSKILACDFEIFGLVQGVSFRMYTERQAKELGVRGWCMNTRNDTVKGQIEATAEAFKTMRHWLEKVGSPTCRIEKSVFSETKELKNFTFKDFQIRH